jgi:hypothetical protein
MKIADLSSEGPMLSSEADAADLVGQFYGQGIDTVVIPVARMAPAFWQLRTKLAGLFIQKLIQYGLRPAFIGDLSAEIAASDALRDYFRECNRRKDVLFAADRAALEALL